MSHQDRFLLLGVMGWPVMHSRSPLMHNYWFDQQGLAGAYLLLAIEPGGGWRGAGRGAARAASVGLFGLQSHHPP